MGRRRPSTKRWQGRGGCLAEAFAAPLALLFTLAEWPPVPWLERMQRSLFYGNHSVLLTGMVMLALWTGLLFAAWFVARRVILVLDRRQRGREPESSPANSPASPSNGP